MSNSGNIGRNLFNIKETDEEIKDLVSDLDVVMNPNPMSMITSHQNDDEQGTDNTDSEEVAIKQSCQFIEKLVDSLNKGGLDRMSRVSRKDLHEIRAKFLELDIKVEVEDEKEMLESGKKVLIEKPTNLKKYNEEGAIPKSIRTTQKIKVPIIKNSSSEQDGLSDSSTDESKASSRASKVSGRSRSSRRGNGREDLLTRLLDKLDNRRVPQLEDFDEKSGEELKEYLQKFEKYCEDNIRGSSNFWVRELEGHLSGETLKAFNSLKDSKDKYHEIKDKLVTWDADIKDIKKKKAKDKFFKMKIEKNEALYLYSNRLEKQFKLAYPKHKTESSKTLIDKFTESVPKNIKKQVKSQIISDKINDRKVHWTSIQKFARYHDVERENEKSDSSSQEEIVINLQHNPQPKRDKIVTPQMFFNDRGINNRFNKSENQMTREPSNFRGNNNYPQYQRNRNNYDNVAKQRYTNMSDSIPNVNNCSFCNRMGHTAVYCRLRLKLCFICGKSGHRMEECYFNWHKSHQRSQSQPPQQNFRQGAGNYDNKWNQPQPVRNHRDEKRDQENPKGSYQRRNRTASN